MSVVVSETNDRIAQLALASDVKQGDYVIGSGDLLGIEVFDVPELSRDVRVNESGLVSLPLLPDKLQAAGLTTFQLQDKLADSLRDNGLVTNPTVAVVVKEQHGQPITVSGAVKTPQRILLAGWLGFLLYAYPGYMLTDVADQLFESRVNEFTDAHAPMMTEVWRTVALVISGPPGMLFLQSLLLLGGTFVLLRRAMTERGWQYCKRPAC